MAEVLKPPPVEGMMSEEDRGIQDAFKEFDSGIGEMATKAGVELKLAQKPVVAPVAQENFSVVSKEPPTRDEEIASLRQRIIDKGKEFADPTQREQLIKDGVFTEDEAQAMLETGVVSDAPDNKVHIAFTDQSWKDAVAKTADDVFARGIEQGEVEPSEITDVPTETLDKQPPYPSEISQELGVSEMERADNFEGLEDKMYSEVKLPEEVTMEEFFAARKAYDAIPVEQRSTPESVVREKFNEKVEALYPEWGKQYDVASLRERIIKYGGSFANLNQRSGLVDEHGNRVFTPEEEKAMLETGVVSDAPDNKVHIAFTDQSWKEAIAATVDRVAAMEREAGQPQTKAPEGEPPVTEEATGSVVAPADGSVSHAEPGGGQGDRSAGIERPKTPEEIKEENYNRYVTLVDIVVAAKGETSVLPEGELAELKKLQNENLEFYERHMKELEKAEANEEAKEALGNLTPGQRAEATEENLTEEQREARNSVLAWVGPIKSGTGRLTELTGDQTRQITHNGRYSLRDWVDQMLPEDMPNRDQEIRRIMESQRERLAANLLKGRITPEDNWLGLKDILDDKGGDFAEIERIFKLQIREETMQQLKAGIPETDPEAQAQREWLKKWADFYDRLGKGGAKQSRWSGVPVVSRLFGRGEQEKTKEVAPVLQPAPAPAEPEKPAVETVAASNKLSRKEAEREERARKIFIERIGSTVELDLLFGADRLALQVEGENPRSLQSLMREAVDKKMESYGEAGKAILSDARDSLAKDMAEKRIAGIVDYIKKANPNIKPEEEDALLQQLGIDTIYSGQDAQAIKELFTKK